MQPTIGNPRSQMEVFKSLPEGTLAEIINGKIFMSPSPTSQHQIVVRELAFVIYQFIRQNKSGAEVFFAPLDVFLDEHSNAAEPDIIFVSAENKDIVKREAIHGVPDLIVEVISPGNADHDLIRKKDLYEQAGVSEYWVVVSETKESIGFLLKDGKYFESGRYVGRILSTVLGNTEFAI